MSTESIKEYINKGIEHYRDEIKVLHTQSEKSTKYMYNKGALDALTNLITFLKTESKAATAAGEEPVKPQCFEAVIPTLFELDKKFYENLISSIQPLFLKVENSYHIIGECDIGIVNNIIYIKGEVMNSKLLQAHNAIIISEVGQSHVLELVRSGTSNLQVL